MTSEQSSGVKQASVVTSEIGYVAKQYPELNDTQRAEVGEFLQALEDHDDVQRVWAALK